MVSATLGASAPQATIPDVTQQTNRDSVRNFREVILATPLRRCKIHFRCQKFLETGSIHALILGEGENRVTSSFCLSLDATSLDPGLKRDQNGIGTATSCRLLTECVPKSFFQETSRISHEREITHECSQGSTATGPGKTVHHGWIQRRVACGFTGFQSEHRPRRGRD